MTHFERLGLPGRFSVDLDAVERAYLARSREVHPDFHGLADADRQRASLEETAALNEAYLTLKDPFRRAEYLLTLFGGPTAQEEKNLDQAFLMEMMDLRERIEEASDAESNDLRSELTARLGRITGGISEQFEKLEQSAEESAARSQGLIAVRQLLNAAKTVRTLLRDLDGG